MLGSFWIETEMSEKGHVMQQTYYLITNLLGEGSPGFIPNLRRLTDDPLPAVGDTITFATVKQVKDVSLEVREIVVIGEKTYIWFVADQPDAFALRHYGVDAWEWKRVFLPSQFPRELLSKAY